MPLEQIEAVVEPIEHQPHREYLQDRLQKLAHAGIESQLEQSELDLDKNIAGSSTLETQGLLTGDCFSQASNELGKDAGEDALWDRVFENQLNYVQRMWKSEPFAGTVAANMLVNNLLSTYGKSPEDAQDILDKRMWSIARSGMGVEILATAHEHVDLCVVSEDPAQPYHSIIEQTEDYGHLFYATSASLNTTTHGVNIPVEQLQRAGLDDKAWFFQQAIRRQNYPLVETNKQFISESESRDLALQVLGKLRRPLEEFNAAGLTKEPLTHFDYATAVVKDGRSPAYDPYVNLTGLSASEQNTLFKSIAESLGHSGIQDTMYADAFSQLDGSSFELWLKANQDGDGNSLPFKGFVNLPEGAYEQVKASGIPDYRIMDGARAFDINDKKQLFNDLKADPAQRYMLFNDPKVFDFMAPEALLEVARECKQLGSVASNLENWTDGSDKTLLLELLDDGHASSVTHHIDKLPGINKEWFLDELVARNEHYAMAVALKHIPNIDQSQLFSAILGSDDAETVLRFTLASFSELQPAEVLDRMLEHKLYDAVAGNIEYFKGNTPDSILQRMQADPDSLEAITTHIDNFPQMDRRWLAEQLVDNDKLYSLAAKLEDFLEGGNDLEWMYSHIKSDPDALSRLTWTNDFGKIRDSIGKERIFEDMLALDDLSILASNIDSFDSPVLEQRFVDVAIAKRAANDLTYGLQKLQHLMPLSIAWQCLEAGWETPVALAWGENYFLKDIDAADIPSARQLLDKGAAATLLMHREMYPDTPVDEALSQVIAQPDDELLARVVDHVQDIKMPSEVLERLAGTDYSRLLGKKKELFNPADFTTVIIEGYLAAGNSDFADLYAYSGVHIDWVDKGLKDFGVDAPNQLLYASREINRQTDDPLPAHFELLGVTARGNVGVNQLRSFNAKLRQQFIEGAQDESAMRSFVEITTSNPLAKSIAHGLTRFNISEWGGHGEDEWTRILHKHLDTLGSQAPLRAEFAPSKTYNVSKIDAKTFDPSNIDIDAREQYELLLTDLQAGLAIAEKPAAGKYNELFDKAQQILSAELSQLAASRDKFVTEGKDKALFGIDRRIASVTEITNMSAREFLHTFRSDFGRFNSLKIKQLDSVMRSGIYARAIKRSPYAHAAALELSTAPPNPESLSAMNTFVDHIINREVYKDYFANDKSRKAFENISDTAALRNQLTKIQKGASSGQTTVQFIPSRGLPLELSGHIGDACWASKYDSIAAEFPNITAITMVRNPGTKTERLIGAGLAIDTEDTEGNKVMVLRGINPIENYINTVKVEEFMDAYLDYAKGVAGDRKLAVVIDDHVGGATSNRPVLYEHLAKNFRGARTTGRPLRLSRNSTFNGYELTPRQHPAYTVAR